MKISFPIAAALGLVVLWVGMLFAIPVTLDLFKDFKVEMPALTMVLLWFYHLFAGLALPLLVLMVALLLAFRQSLDWVFAVALCFAWGVAFVGLCLPVISLMNNLSGGDGTATFPTNAAPSFGSAPIVWIGIAGLLANLILLVSLLRNRRTFFVPLTRAVIAN